MFNYEKCETTALAKQYGFRNETLEKVLRLIGVLYDALSSYLVLKVVLPLI